MKTCRDCGEDKLEDEFYKNPSYYCKDCFRKRSTSSYHKNKTNFNHAARRVRSGLWAKDNLERYKAHHANAAAKRRQASGKHTDREFETLCKAWSWSCAYCCRELCRNTVVRDHVIPLYSGGDNTIHNILPSCAECNRSKSSLPLGTWLISKGIG